MQARKLSDVQADYQATTPKYTCMVCEKKIEGFYGAWGTNGTCSGACEKIQAAKYPYPNHSEEDFFKRFKGASHGRTTQDSNR